MNIPFTIPLEGKIIATLFVLSVILIPILKLMTWRARWGAARLLGNTLVRFDPAVQQTTELVVGLQLGNAIVRDVIRETVSGSDRESLLRFRVDVIPDGAMPTLDGIERVERALPVTPRICVARIEERRVENDAPYFVAHEISRHAMPLIVQGNGDGDHLLVRWAPVEAEMKRRMKLAGLGAEPESSCARCAGKA